ncbi:sporulation initiation phosphotransferase B [Rossellomorea aquimaris]|uniref:Spo0B C-terminal domain-containing protein n=1 Tax=Rossellomorea aquimaris TaxID=189382 RepID=UPI001CD77EA7|nr:Spo0B C-terminal domain-containing protein [Rossellomorea aquimaris]MCA1056303.1 sporulation initiation phosphotransferase B [Rossellomorea aquimaris]
MSDNRGILDALRHARHDWMNDLQLIKGNLELNRVERAKQVIDTMVITAQNESKLCNLRLPLLAEWILTYNWSTHMVKLEFEVGAAGYSGYLDDERLVHICKGLMELLETTVESSAENQLSMIIDFSEEHPRFIFDFTGILKETDVLERWIEIQQKNGNKVETELLQKEAFVIHLSVE